MPAIAPSGKGRFFKNYLPAPLWAVVLFLLSSIPSSSVPSIGVKFEDLIAHTVVYAIFGFLLGNALIYSPDRVRWNYLFGIALIGILYGASDEFHQSFVAGRYATVSDLVADAIGVLVGLVLFVNRNRLIGLFLRKAS